jgi:AcrR family transcriptional regulator
MSNTLTRHDRRRLETRNRILLAGAELFGQQGLHATKVVEICADADVAQQTFFNHFPSKGDLVRELALRGHDFLLETIEEAHREGGCTAERLTLLFGRIPNAVAGTGPMHHELLAELVRTSHEDHDPERSQQVHRAIGAIVTTGHEEGEVTRAYDTEDLAELIFGALHILMAEWAIRPDFPIAQRSARMARLLAEVLAPREGELAHGVLP